MRLSSIFYPNEYTSDANACDIEFSSIAYRLQDIKEGAIFICTKGTKFDSHAIVSSLSARGVVAVIADKKAKVDKTTLPVFYVTSTRRTLAYLWNRFVGDPIQGMTIVGITGTNGKTSTAYFLNRILLACGLNCAMIGTLGLYLNGVPDQKFNDPRVLTMTTPDPDILYPFLAHARECGVTHVVMEVSSHALAYDKVAPIVFSDAVFTNLSPEHLDFHKTMGEYAEAKRRLFVQTKHATINCDDACGAAILSSPPCNATSCGIVWGGDATASQLEQGDSDCYTYFYSKRNIKQKVRLSVSGKYQVYNSLLALTSAIHLDIPAGCATAALSAVSAIPGRLEQVSAHEDDIRVYIDFAHTETALKELLIGLKAITKHNLIVVFGCGGERDVLKRPLMGACAMKYADFSVITSDNSRGEDVKEILKGILHGHQDPNRRKVIVDRERAIQYAILSAEKGDVIVLAGKGHEQYEIKKDGIHPFSESEIARHALELRRAGNTNSCTEVQNEN